MAETRLDAIFAVCKDVWERRPELEQQFGSPVSLGYWDWLMSTGWEQHEELRRVLPIPPVHLMRRVHGDCTESFFQESGLSDAANVISHLAAAGFEFGPGKSVLDFGCGCSRLLRILARFGDSTALFGADIDEDAVQWSREVFDFIGYEVIQPDPPTPFEDASFDAVYAFSVFSHLAEPRARAWIAELRRITRPGAAVLFTVQGESCAQRFVKGDAFGLTFPAADVLEADLPRLRSEGLLFYPYENVDLPAHLADPQGMTFVTEQFVSDALTDGFEMVAYDVAPTGWQDFVALRRLA